MGARTGCGECGAPSARTGIHHPGCSRAPSPISRRLYLTLVAMERGASWPLATEAVSTTAIEHPEWDMEELRTFGEWESRP